MKIEKDCGYWVVVYEFKKDYWGEDKDNEIKVTFMRQSRGLNPFKKQLTVPGFTVVCIKNLYSVDCYFILRRLKGKRIIRENNFEEYVEKIHANIKKKLE